MAEHTPGPWTIDTTVALGAYGVWTDYATHPGHDGAGYGSQICKFEIMGVIALEKDVRMANARLIAAAPDMLHMLQSIYHAPSSHLFGDEEIGNLIAKATGDPDNPSK